jgi:hypothetical protein
MSIPTPSFWNNNTDLQTQVQQLQDLVPCEGEVVDKRKNRKLEKFRKASNVYYDLFNNGLGNRASELRPIFGLRVVDYYVNRWSNGRRYKEIENRLYVDIEPLMRQIVIDACVEQNIGI